MKVTLTLVLDVDLDIDGEPEEVADAVQELIERGDFIVDSITVQP